MIATLYSQLAQHFANRFTSRSTVVTHKLSIKIRQTDGKKGCVSREEVARCCPNVRRTAIKIRTELRENDSPFWRADHDARRIHTKDIKDNWPLIKQFKQVQMA